MNLLLVDDEEYVVESIKKHLDFQDLGVNGVYTAFSMGQAQMMMELLPIHVVVSDIVMPQGSGFDFMEWVRKEGYETQVIFLTSYAEFDFAKRAMDLDSVDYLLKPIDFTVLRDALQKAVQKAEEVKRAETYREESRKWKQNKCLLQKNFWKEIFHGLQGEELLQEEFRQKRFGFGVEDTFAMVYLVTSEKDGGGRNGGIRDLSGDTFCFILGNVMEELIGGEGWETSSVFTVSTNGYIMILHDTKGADTEERRTGYGDQRLAGSLENLLQWLGEKLLINLWCGVGICTGLCEVQTLGSSLRQMRENSLSVWNRVLYLRAFEQPQTSYQNPHLPVWGALLREHKAQEIMDGAKRYLSELNESEMITRDLLKKFRLDITQMVYSWLAEQEIKAHLLFSSPESEEYDKKALDSLEGALDFADYLLKRAIEYGNYVNQTESVTEQIKRYLDKHYQEDIRRDDLAGMVYLNTDYMSRIFKKEMGVSISSYLLAKRVEEAKKLLTQSNLPINTVSLYVGYSNFSYFTKMFRENTGYSPLEYRRVCRRHE